MRIVYYTPPSTPSAYFWLMAKATGLAYIGLILLFFLLGLLGGGYSTVFMFFHEIFYPLTNVIFGAAGLQDLSAGESGLYTLYLLLQLPALFNTLPMMRFKLEQLALLDEAYGPVKKPEHLGWFYGAFVFAFCCLAMRYVPPFDEATGLMKAMSDCLRILFTLGFGLGALCFTIIGIRLRGSWLKSPDAVKLPGAKPARKARSRANLKVAIDNTKPAPAGLAPLPPASMNNTDMGIYVAMTTEMIQAAGRTKQAPAPGALLATLEMLQKAALITRSGQFSHHDLKGLCERACNLFLQGQLTHMPDMKAAQALYKKPDPTRLTAIAAELKALLEAPAVN